MLISVTDMSIGTASIWLLNFHVYVYFGLTGMLLVNGLTNESNSTESNIVKGGPAFSVDRTPFIKEVIEKENNILLVATPTGFGKTRNLKLLKSFLETEFNKKEVQNSKANPASSQTTNSTLFPNNPYNFTDLKPTTNQFHKYPVINLSFECFIAVDSFKEAIKFYKRVVHRLFKDHKYLIKSERLSLHDRKLVRFWSDDHNFYTFSTEQVMTGLRELTRLICRHWDSRCWVLLDDYDHVVQAAMLEMADNDKFRRVVKFTYRMITHAFRNNSDCVYGGVVAGELPLAVFGVKDFVKYKMYNFLEDHEFVKYFGLTSEEVEGILSNLSKNKSFRTEVEKNCWGYMTSSGEKLFNINLLNRFLNGEKSNHGSEVKDELRNIVKIPLFREILETILEGETVDFHKINVFDLNDLVDLRSILLNSDLEITPRIFNLLISYLFHKGVLAYSEPTKQTANTMNISYAKIPNNYMKEAIKSVLY